MKPNTETSGKDVEKGEEHLEKGTTKTIGDVKRADNFLASFFSS